MSKSRSQYVTLTRSTRPVATSTTKTACPLRRLVPAGIETSRFESTKQSSAKKPSGAGCRLTFLTTRDSRERIYRGNDPTEQPTHTIRFAATAVVRVRQQRRRSTGVYTVRSAAYERRGC